MQSISLPGRLEVFLRADGEFSVACALEVALETLHCVLVPPGGQIRHSFRLASTCLPLDLTFTSYMLQALYSTSALATIRHSFRLVSTHSPLYQTSR